MVPLPATSVSFLDFGSGKGRAVISAATFPFKRVTGVEISAYLNDIAKENVARMRHRRAKHVELVQSDATEFAVADDTNVIYMANPFFGITLEKVVANILASYHARPRPLYIIYFNKIYFEKLIEHADFHMIKTRYLTHCNPNYSCGLYEITQADAARSHETSARGSSE
jgi:SAM-dependent methyltransferase